MIDRDETQLIAMIFMGDKRRYLWVSRLRTSVNTSFKQRRSKGAHGRGSTDNTLNREGLWNKEKLPF
jgi:hypothetical protein